jgi:PAS domain S-box-containing protein
VASYGGVELPPGIVERLAMHFLEGSPERFKPTIIEIDGINRLGHNAEEIFRSLGVRLLSITPEIVGGKLTGLLCLASTSDGARFPVERLPLLLTLTHQMGVALENARLYRELLSSQKRYKNLADNIKDIMFALDGHLVITYVNNAITAAMGYASEELVGTNIGALVTGNPLNAPGIEAMRRIIAGGDDGPLLIMECARKDGGTEMVEVMITPVRDGDAHTMFQGIARVITQKLRWEQDMKRRNEEQNMLLSLSTVLAASPQLGTLGDGVSMQRLPASDPRTSLMMVLDEAARLTAEFLHVEIVSVHTVDRESGGLTRLMRYSAPGVDRFTSPGHFDLISWDPDLKDFMGQTRPIAISDLDQRPSNFPMAESLRAGGMRSFIIAPLVHAGLPVGTLSAATVTATREFNESDMNLLVSIASHVALAVLNAQYLEEVTRQKADLELLSNQLITGQEEDRRRIARELHDEAGQSLYALRLSLDMLKGGLKQVGSQGLADMVDEQLKVVSQTIDNIRRITYDLRPALLDDLGLIPALRWYVDNYGKRTGLEVELELVECDFKLEGSAEVNIYRIIQEALTNVYRHAHATRVSVRMVAGAGLLKIEIQDDGRGFSAASKAAGGGGVGLIGIKERITSLGGSLLVYSLQGRGTTLGIEIPLH